MFNQGINYLFAAQVARSPSAIAVVCGNKQLTYLELNNKANQLAVQLQSMGVKPEVKVGICIDRCVEMIVGLLGILKSGGTYVPLDPVYPTTRLNYMVQDAQISVLVTQTKWSTLISEYFGEVICLDNQPDEFDSGDRSIINTLQPSNLAYVIYTSGSTGKPKGVMIEHHSMSNFIEKAIAQYKISQGDRILQFASISFDVALE